MRPQQPVPIDPNRQMMIVLPAFAWNTVLACLRKQPYELVEDIIAELRQQFTQQANEPPAPANPPDDIMFKNNEAAAAFAAKEEAATSRRAGAPPPEEDGNG